MTAKLDQENPSFPSKLPSVKSKVEIDPTVQDFPVHQTNLKRKIDETDHDVAASSSKGERVTKEPVSKLKKVASGPSSNLQKSTISSSSREVAKPKTAPKVAPKTGPVTKRVATVTKPAPPAKKTVVAKAAPTKPVTRNQTALGSAVSVQKPIDLPPPKRKRKEYDVKGRLQDLEEQYIDTASKLEESQSLINSMTNKLDDSQSTIKELIEFKHSLESKVQTKEHEKSMVEQELKNLEQMKEELVQKHKLEMNVLEKEHQSAIDLLKDQIKKLEATKDELQSQCDLLKAECNQYKLTISSQSAAQFALENEKNMLKTMLQTSETMVQLKDKELKELTEESTGLKETIKELEAKATEHERIRKQMHNEIQELKGNIRVFCRMRPILETEANDQDSNFKIEFPSEKPDSLTLTQSIDSASGTKQSKTFPFTFDKVFTPSSQQSQVFEEISQLVQSALDGYNICIFAYGQTGSGKTFTMEGPNQSITNEVDAGMIPRAVEQIYSAAKRLSEQGWEYTMEAQFLEIYNETLRDLLSDGNDSKKLEIKHDHLTGQTTVSETTVVKVDSPAQVYSLLQKASDNRAVAATNCNERSSRSHSVFTLKLKGFNSLTEESTVGNLNLIDLAGSERLSTSGATGDRLKETQAINKSLSCLGDVIYALSNKDAHIPYRNSKLTYLLQNSLGGNSKTLMFVNISPLSSSFQETLCSLRFATKVNSCQIGTARKQTK